MSNFDKLAKIYDSFLFQPYSSHVQKWCINFLKDFIKNGHRVLDIGCGTASFFYTLKNKSLELIGIDESEKMIFFAKKKFENIKFVVGKAENLPFENDYFDLIVIQGSFHYFQNQKASFLECYRTLKNGGRLVVTLPQCDNFLQKFRMNVVERNIFGLFFGNVKKDCLFISFDDLLLLAKQSKLYLVKTATKSFEGIKTRLVIFEKYL